MKDNEILPITNKTVKERDSMNKKMIGVICLMIATLMLGINLIWADGNHAGEVSGQSPEELTRQLEEADFYVQNGYLYEFETLKLASEGKLLTCFGNNAGSTYLILNLPAAFSVAKKVLTVIINTTYCCRV